jgi:chemotaxis protein methyltransferase CheR
MTMLGEASPPPMSEEEFRLLRDLFHEHCGIFVRDEMRYLIERRLGPRVVAHGLRTFHDYHRFLRLDPLRRAELDEATDLLTTNETYLYREPYQLRAFSHEILPRLAEEHGTSRRLTVLSAGCATGEEAYTIAILIRDAGLFAGWDVSVTGVDISHRCVAHAREGAYGEHAFRTVEADLVRRWFHLRGGKWLVDSAIRRMVRFEQVNLMHPEALATLPACNVVFCRNVMIYFDLAARKRLLARFQDKMQDGAWLLLGHSESLLNVTSAFEIVHLRNDLVYRKPGARGRRPEGRP